MAGPRIQDLPQQPGTGWTRNNTLPQHHLLPTNSPPCGTTWLHSSSLFSPAERPQASRHPMVWRPGDLVGTNSSIFVVDQEGGAEVTQALASFKGKTNLHLMCLAKSQLTHTSSAWTRWRRRQSGELPAPESRRLPRPSFSQYSRRHRVCYHQRTRPKQLHTRGQACYLSWVGELHR